jgi:hypothetical protein
MAYLAGYDGDHAYPMVAQVAVQQGRLASKNIVALDERGTPRSFRYSDKGQMAIIGRRSGSGRRVRSPPPRSPRLDRLARAPPPQPPRREEPIHRLIRLGSRLHLMDPQRWNHHPPRATATR